MEVEVYIKNITPDETKMWVNNIITSICNYQEVKADIKIINGGKIRRIKGATYQFESEGLPDSISDIKEEIKKLYQK